MHVYINMYTYIRTCVCVIAQVYACIYVYAYKNAGRDRVLMLSVIVNRFITCEVFVFERETLLIARL